MNKGVEMTSQEFDTHLKTASPYDCYTYAFNQSEVNEIKKALEKDTWINEVRKLIKEGENNDSN